MSAERMEKEKDLKERSAAKRSRNKVKRTSRPRASGARKLCCRVRGPGQKRGRSIIYGYSVYSSRETHSLN